MTWTTDSPYRICPMDRINHAYAQARPSHRALISWSSWKCTWI